ncbi:MAG: S8 family serine peptidase, partial [Bdellovibrionota bacterium]
SAAGNDGAWKDSFERLGMPCGIKAPNALCVGALRENGEPAPFTDIPIGGVDLVFALGHRVFSTIPTEICSSQAVTDTYFFDETTTTEKLREVGAKIKKECLETPGFAYLSGTSMATPLVAHVAAEILAKKPNLNGAGVIQEIYKRAMPDFIGIIPVYKLKIAKPSWYKPYIPKSLIEEQALAQSDEDPDFFTGYVPQLQKANTK